MSESKNIRRNANRPRANRGGHIQGATSSGSKSETKDAALQRALDSWKELSKTNETKSS